MAGKGELYERSDGKWGFRVKTPEGEPVATDSGPGHPEKAAAKDTLEKLMRGDFDGPIEEGTAPVCGSEITENTTLDSDLVCEGGPAFVIAADNVTLDLGGHTISGSPDGSGGPGILFQGVSGSAVQNGTVERFDAGVVVDGGSGNHVMHMTIRDNIGSPEGDYGDGVVVMASTDNLIHDNTIERNGPYSGIALGREAQGNQVRNNVVTDNNMMHTGQPSAGRQAMGIRVEGPAANDNKVSGNTVTGSGASGIALLATCANDANCVGTPPNENNEVTQNVSDRNGTSGQGDGITIFSLPNPITPVHNTLEGNTANDNRTNGIAMQMLGNNNVGTTENHALRNSAKGNRAYDGFDGNPACATNEWEDNDFGTVNQPCVRGRVATQRVVPSG